MLNITSKIACKFCNTTSNLTFNFYVLEIGDYAPNFTADNFLTSTNIMQNNPRIDGMTVAKYKLSVITEDPEVLKHHPELMEACWTAMTFMEKQIMTLRKQSTTERNGKGKNQRKQTGTQVQRNLLPLRKR